MEDWRQEAEGERSGVGEGEGYRRGSCVEGLERDAYFVARGKLIDKSAAIWSEQQAADTAHELTAQDLQSDEASHASHATARHAIEEHKGDQICMCTAFHSTTHMHTPSITHNSTTNTRDTQHMQHMQHASHPSLRPSVPNKNYCSPW